MRRPLCLLALLALIEPAVALAGTTYSPRFAREEVQAQVMAFDLGPKPVYPRSSLRNEEQGTVTYRFTIGPNGRVLNSQILRSSGFRDLDRAGLSALSQWFFRPASINGRPVQAPMDIQYVWTLE